jgi:CelD/BcsL family acetyltransferase involved in cellulose biosynthesis
MSTMSLSRLAGRLRGLFAGELKLSAAENAPHELQVGELRVACFTDWDGSRLRTAWNGLSARAGLATTFQSSTWLMDGVAPTVRSSALRLFTVNQNEKLLAVVPFELTENGFLDNAGYNVSDYLDPLVDEEMGREAWRALLAMLAEVWDRNVRGLTLHNVRPEAPSRQLLQSLAPEFGFACEESVISNAARLKLPGTWDEYLETLDGHERKELRRKIRKAETQANARLVLIDQTNFEAEHLNTALDLIEAANEEKGEWLRTHVRPLMQRVGAKLAKEGRMRLHMLMLNEKPGACIIEFPYAQGPLLYNSGFDPNQRQWSPGAVTFGMLIRDSIARGAKVVDFLRGREEYKYRLGAADEPLYRLSLRLA